MINNPYKTFQFLRVDECLNTMVPFVNSDGDRELCPPMLLRQQCHDVTDCHVSEMSGVGHREKWSNYRIKMSCKDIDAQKKPPQILLWQF